MEFAGAFRYSSSIVTVMRVDDGAFVDVNAAFERIAGIPRDEAIGRMPIDLGVWQDHEIRALIWGRLRTRRYIAAEPVVFRARDGTRYCGKLSCEMFEHDGSAHVLAIVQDVEAGDAPLPAAARAGIESYRALFLAAAEGIYRSLPDGGFIDVNPAMAHIFGYASPAQMLSETSGAAVKLYVDASHGAWVRAELQARGRLEETRSRVYRRDGSRIWISENARTVTDDNGEVLFYEGTVIDITERLAAEAALRQSEALYKVLVENCRDGVFLIQRGHIVFANPALSHMLGYAPDELNGMEYFRLIAPEDIAAQAQRRTAREAGSRATQSYEIRLLRKDGSRTLFSVHADAIEYNGDIASTGVMRDITEERRRQLALEDAERKYRELFEHSPIGLFRTHVDGTILEVNAALARLLGYASGAELKAAKASMLEIYADPAQREPLVALVRASGGMSNVRAQLRRADGVPVWVEVSVEQHVRGDGEVLFEGSVQDIDKRVAIEAALQESEARYRNLVEHSQVGVYLMRGDCYTYVNAAFAQMVGYPERELVGMSYRQLLAPDSVRLVDERIARRARGEQIEREYEIALRRPDGAITHATVSAGHMVLGGETLVGGTMRDITRHRQAEQRLKFHATHDALTGMPNRLLFQQKLQDTMNAARRSGNHGYSVLYLDLDGFKLVNDSLGHAAGDRLLIVIAEKLGEALGGEALIARYGGDEFTILPQGACDRARAQQVAERVLALFADSFDIGGHRVFSGASVGIVLGRPEYRSPDHVLRDADTAMYRAKAAGKSGFVVFDETMHRAARLRFQLETDLRLALTRAEFRVHYQPIVALESGAIVGCEALVRWQHPERGLLTPSDFLSVAEEAGLIAELDWWVLEQTCHQLLAWQKRYPAYGGLRANVNVDDRQFNDPGLVANITAVLARCGTAAHALSLEVTETVFRNGRGQAGQTLAALKQIGVGLVVDDFGTGYSSLDSFASSPFDALKVDRSFVHDMETNRRHRAIVRTITGFADDLGLELTAEGVETQGQARLLAELGCVTAQGYLYSPALPASEFESLLQESRQLARTA